MRLSRITIFAGAVTLMSFLCSASIGATVRYGGAVRNWEAYGELSCVSPGHCVAVGDFLSAVTADGGAMWSTRKMQGSMLDIACSSSSHCVAVGTVGEGAVMASTKDGGASWRYGSWATHGGWHTMESVSCPSVSKCVAIGAGGIGITADGGVKWSHVQTSSVSIPKSLANSCTECSATSVSCLSLKKCLAYYAEDQTKVAVRLGSDDGGLSWSAQAVTLPDDTGISDVECVSSTHCIAIGSAGLAAASNYGGPLLYSSDGGLSWSEPDSGSLQGVRSVSCWSAISCVATGDGYIAYRSDDAGASWSRAFLPNTVRLTPRTVTEAEEFNAVSCAPGGFCLATARYTGLVISSQNGGKTWKIPGKAARAGEWATATSLIITPDSLGAVRVGMSQAQAQAASGEPLSIYGDGFWGPASQETGRPPGSTGLGGVLGSREFVDCLVATGNSSDVPRVSTTAGVRLGDTIRKLLRIYGSSAHYYPASPHGGISPAPGYVVNTSAGDLSFWYTKGVVTEIATGPGASSGEEGWCRQSASSTPDLYVSTGADPGSLFSWPHFPSSIQTANVDGFALTWALHGSTTAIGSGTYSYDECTPTCAAGHYKRYAATVVATSPKTCTVEVWNRTTGALTPTRTTVFSSVAVKWGAQGRPPFLPTLNQPCS